MRLQIGSMSFPYKKENHNFTIRTLGKNKTKRQLLPKFLEDSQV